MTAVEIGNELVALCKAGKPDEVMTRFYDANIVSIEATGENPKVQGIEAVLGKVAWWDANMTVHGWTVEGPYPNGDQFAVRHTLDVTDKASGNRFPMDEIAVYTVKNGKIVEERFFYTM